MMRLFCVILKHCVKARMCEISGEKEVTILKMHRNIFFTDRKEVHHSPKENQETLCFSILPPSEFFIEYIFVPVINSKQYHVRQRIENLICQSELHSLLMLECKKMLSSDNNLSQRPKLILHIYVRVMIFIAKVAKTNPQDTARTISDNAGSSCQSDVEDKRCNNLIA